MLNFERLCDVKGKNHHDDETKKRGYRKKADRNLRSSSNWNGRVVNDEANLKEGNKMRKNECATTKNVKSHTKRVK